jgi:hypothetical protein
MWVGDFTTYKGVAAIRIIRLNPDGSKDTDFDNSTGFNNTVLEFQLDSNNKLYVGGAFHGLQRSSCKSYHTP